MGRNKLSKALEKVAREKGLIGEPRPSTPTYFITGTFEIDAHIMSEMNLREHWATRKRRFDEQKCAVGASVSRQFARMVGEWMQTFQSRGLVRVTLTRIGKRKLDDDNLSGGFKAVRDAIAEMIGVDDGSELFKWDYAQEVGPEYAARVTVTTEAK